MRLPRLLDRALTYRRVIKLLERQALATEQLASAVARIADKLAPIVVEASEGELKQTSISFSRDAESAKVLEFVENMQRDLGREPSEQEIADYLDGVPV